MTEEIIDVSNQKCSRQCRHNITSWSSNITSWSRRIITGHLSDLCKCPQTTGKTQYINKTPSVCFPILNLNKALKMV